METHIYDEKNGLSYTLHGDYYLPDLVLNEEKTIYGKYGMLRKQFPCRCWGGLHHILGHFRCRMTEVP